MFHWVAERKEGGETLLDVKILLQDTVMSKGNGHLVGISNTERVLDLILVDFFRATEQMNKFSVINNMAKLHLPVW